MQGRRTKISDGMGKGTHVKKHFIDAEMKHCAKRSNHLLEAFISSRRSDC